MSIDKTRAGADIDRLTQLLAPYWSQDITPAASGVTNCPSPIDTFLTAASIEDIRLKSNDFQEFSLIIRNRNEWIDGETGHHMLIRGIIDQCALAASKAKDGEEFPNPPYPCTPLGLCQLFASYHSLLAHCMRKADGDDERKRQKCLIEHTHKFLDFFIAYCDGFYRIDKSTYQSYSIYYLASTSTRLTNDQWKGLIEHELHSESQLLSTEITSGISSSAATNNTAIALRLHICQAFTHLILLLSVLTRSYTTILLETESLLAILLTLTSTIQTINREDLQKTLLTTGLPNISINILSMQLLIQRNVLILLQCSYFSKRAVARYQIFPSIFNQSLLLFVNLSTSIEAFEAQYDMETLFREFHNIIDISSSDKPYWNSSEVNMETVQSIENTLMTTLTRIITMKRVSYCCTVEYILSLYTAIEISQHNVTKDKEIIKGVSDILYLFSSSSTTTNTKLSTPLDSLSYARFIRCLSRLAPYRDMIISRYMVPMVFDTLTGLLSPVDIESEHSVHCPLIITTFYPDIHNSTILSSNTKDDAIKSIHRCLAAIIELCRRTIYPALPLTSDDVSMRHKSMVSTLYDTFAVYTNNKELLHLYSDSTTGILSLYCNFLQLDEQDNSMFDNYHLECFSGNLWNVAELGDANVGNLMIQYEIPKLALKHIQKAMKTGRPATRWLSYVPQLMNCIMNLCRREEACQQLAAIGGVEVFTTIYQGEKNGTERIKAMIVLAFLIGSKEDASKPAIKQSDKPEVDSASNSSTQPSSESGATSATQAGVLVFDQTVITAIVEIFGLTLQNRGGRDWQKGTFCFPLLLHACMEIARSDTNKPLLLNTKLLKFLYDFLNFFATSGKKEMNICGGGTNDLESTELAIEVLFLLSFHFPMDDELQKSFIAASSDYVELLEKLKSGQPPSRHVGTDAHKKLHNLSLRLKNTVAGTNATALVSKPIVDETISSSTSNANGPPPKHVMLSYCWNSTANPQFVKALAAELRTMGIDVWRDEDGSTIVPPMSGSVDERMADAIQASDTIVICVSSAYKKSSNCRLEASYASVLSKRGAVKLVFVMMNANYTTVSEPEYVDGWLGILVGGALWVPMWDSNHVSSAAKSIADQLGPGTYLNKRVKVTSSPVKSAPPEIMQTPSKVPVSMPIAPLQTEVRPIQSTIDPLTAMLDEVWLILHSEGVATDSSAMKSYLEDIGLVSSNLLKYCDENVVVKISQYLKIVPQKGFVILMNRIREKL